jgi:hypothetical protein
MNSSTTPEFWAFFAELPPEIQLRARVVYKLWLHNPRHPSLQFKKVGPMWSVRIGGGYRALAFLEMNTYHWVWIGNHDEYDVQIR